MDSKYLREQISISTSNYCSTNNIKYKLKTDSGVIIFDNAIKPNLNFNPDSYSNIIKHKEWSNRLNKKHTSFDSGQNIAELDSCMSSDALLMNIFCNPSIANSIGLRKLLKIDCLADIKFGFKAKVNLESGVDKTEIDMTIAETFFEAKLTESDFQVKKKEIVHRYSEFHNIFNSDNLVQTKDTYLNYQLIRNILAIKQYKYNFILLCDMRRPDLIRSFIDTISCVKDSELRKRCTFITWQEIARTCNKELREFLELKYGF